MSVKPAKSDPIERARNAWGDQPPEWVLAVAEACQTSTQAVVGAWIGYGNTTVSQIVSNTYRGDLVSVENAVRGALMAEAVECPVLVTQIGRDVCQNWQKRPFSTASANAVRMYQGCRSGCPHSRIKNLKGEDA